MYVRTEIGLGQPGREQTPEERLLRQVLDNGLQFQAEIAGRVRDIKLPPGVAHSPYLPKRHPESREYRALPPDERAKVAATVSRIFKEATGVVRNLDSKDPKDKPWIRIWLTLRDIVMRVRAEETTPTGRVEPVETRPTLPTPEESGRVWDIVDDIAEGLHVVGSVSEVLKIVAEAGNFAPFLVAAAKILGPIGHVAALYTMGKEVIHAFGTGRRLAEQEGFCYGVMWETLGLPNYDKVFLDWAPDTAEERREAFFDGVEKGRKKAQDPRVRSLVFTEMARYVAMGSDKDWAAYYVVNELWTLARETPRASKKLSFPKPADDIPL